MNRKEYLKEWKKKHPYYMKEWYKKINLASDRHHTDYSQPLNVKLLCEKCHYSLHNGGVKS